MNQGFPNLKKVDTDFFSFEKPWFIQINLSLGWILEQPSGGCQRLSVIVDWLRDLGLWTQTGSALLGLSRFPRGSQQMPGTFAKTSKNARVFQMSQVHGTHRRTIVWPETCKLDEKL